MYWRERQRESRGKPQAGAAGRCHPAVCCLKAHSGVNLLKELESSAGCHLFSTLGMLSLSPRPLVLSLVTE